MKTLWQINMEPTITIPTELYRSLVRLLDVMPPILEDWIKTTGYGEICRRDRMALNDVNFAIDLQHRWLAEFGIKVEK